MNPTKLIRVLCLALCAPALGQFSHSPNLQLLAHLTSAQLGVSGGGNDCWGYVSPSGREYAVMCTEDATVFVDLTVPTNPQVIGNIPGPTGIWRDAKVYGEYCYSVCETNCAGVQVIDLTQIDNGSVTLVNTFNGSGSGHSHNVVIDTTSGFLYRCGGGTGLRIYDLNANPVNPPYLGQWSGLSVHDAQVVTHTSGPLAGLQMAVCSTAGGTVTVLDVTNKSNITILSQIAYPNGSISHQGWLSEDLQYYYHGDEGDETNSGLTTTTYVFDMSDPSAAFLASTYTNGQTSIDHNLYTRGEYVFSANYTSGLRVFDASNPTAPVEVGFFDTYPAHNNPAYSGAWSCYPYLPSGVVLISDRQSGLFVVWFGDTLLGENYCSPAVVNSTGLPGRMRATGSSDVSSNDVTLTATHLPPGKLGYFITSQAQGSFMPPGSQGFLCLGGSIGRYNASVGQGPSITLDIDLSSMPLNPATAVQAGETWNFQCWYRDDNPGSTSNFTDGISVTFQ